MGLSDLAKSSTAAKPAPAPAPAAKPVEEANRALSTNYSTTALSAAIAAADSGTGPMFPILYVTGGSNGGMFTPLEGTPQEIINLLPQGRQSVDGVLIGFRTELTSWPVGYDDRDPNEESRPAWSIAVPGSDSENTLAVLHATKKYQFTGKANKHLFDADKSGGVGHSRPVVQLLVWSKNVQDLIVVQSPASYDSWIEGIKTLERLADPKTKELGQFPASITVTSKTKSSKSGNTWQSHELVITVPPTAASAELMNKVREWRSQLPEDKVEAVHTWLSGGDKLLDDSHKELLAKAKNLGA